VLAKGDVTNAYLTAPMPEDEEVLFELPQGYVPKLSAPAGHKVVALSLKAQPGLKQAGRVWNEHLHKSLLEQGFEQCEIAPCIYLKPEGDGFVVAGIFVDDMIFINATTDLNALSRLTKELSKHYEIKLDESLAKFLGCEFVETVEGVYMHLNQYITSLQARFGVNESKRVVTPEEPNQKETSASEVAYLQKSDKKEYMELVGALLFVMTSCRPDIAHAVNVLTRRASEPRVCDMVAARRVLVYLGGTKRLGLFFGYALAAKAQRGLVAYVDADWANDREGRRSTTGYVLLFDGAPISWCSQLQSIVALSTCEAEYIALSECCREVVYMRQMMEFLREPLGQPTVVYEDNQGAIDLTNNPCHHKRSKHIEVKYHFVRRAQSGGEIKVVKVHTDLNRADIMTKAVSVKTFIAHVIALMRAAPSASH
jgi:hypothetical protein